MNTELFKSLLKDENFFPSENVANMSVAYLQIMSWMYHETQNDKSSIYSLN